ncbi:terminase family protein [Methanolobus sp.]|uniref:DNA-packaging protein n=1 Tax=Methanolobus sp. TaxID=1874737 RepID=UPI0025D757FF|nr:terminase family protein [Methanolobus sp.]
MKQERESLAESIALLPGSERQKILSDISDEELPKLEYDWKFWARSNQLPPEGNWQYWLVLSGRGWGKSRVGAEWVRDRVESGKARRIALVAPTAADARDTMVEGESGILSVCPPWNRPVYKPSKRRLTWPNGANALLFSAEEPDRLRGPQHDTAWCDEIAAWKYPDRTWDMLQFGLRAGDDPRAAITTTPRPIPLVKALLNDSSTHVTRGSTYENLSNLAPAFIDVIISRYEGTRLGRQELNAEILDDNPDALWTRDVIENNKVTKTPELVRIVVGVDPAVTSSSSADDTGIVVAAVDERGEYYVLGDHTIHSTPKKWAQEVIAAYYKHSADRVIGEVNNGGELVEYTLRTIDPNVSYKSVRASRGKQTRAEPISALYEQGKVHHVGSFSALEDQMCDWVPGEGSSPDRVDALVWALSELSRSRFGAQELDLSALIRTRPR